MRNRLMTLSSLFFLLIALALACSPQPLPTVPTPIPTLIPATLPAVVGLATITPAAAGPAPELTPGPSTIPTPAAMRTGTASAPTPSTARATPTATPGASGGDLAAGEAVFQRHCAVCHNVNAEEKIGPGLAGLFSLPQLPDGKPVTDPNLDAWIHTGSDKMPPVLLSPQETAQVIAYLKVATQ